MSDLDDACAEYLQLRDRCRSVQLATINDKAMPEASYAPCVWDESDCYLFLSGLSSHTGNLLRHPEISLLLLDDSTAGGNPFARKRASLHGVAEVVERDDVLFTRIMQEFHRSFGKVMQLLEPLPDFRLFRISMSSGSFVRGFGQAFEIFGAGMKQLRQVDPRQ